MNTSATITWALSLGRLVSREYFGSEIDDFDVEAIEGEYATALGLQATKAVGSTVLVTAAGEVHCFWNRVPEVRDLDWASLAIEADLDSIAQRHDLTTQDTTSVPEPASVAPEPGTGYVRAGYPSAWIGGPGERLLSSDDHLAYVVTVGAPDDEDGLSEISVSNFGRTIRRDRVDVASEDLDVWLANADSWLTAKDLVRVGPWVITPDEVSRCFATLA